MTNFYYNKKIMIVGLLNKIVAINEFIFRGFDGFINSFNLPNWLADGIIDSVHIIPLLFIIFLIIEIIEYFYSNKINYIMQKSEKASPLLGSLAAIFPQCGFSIIASTLYVEKFITKGTLIAIYLATSDEAIPILLANPTKIYYVIPLILTKLIVAVIAGYSIDYLLKDEKYVFNGTEDIETPDGCCKHGITTRRKRDLIYHPIKHTFNIFLFILIITLILNLVIAACISVPILDLIINKCELIMPLFTALLGLIPNCAVSIALTMLLIKGSISFGAAIAGLLSNAGLGILILVKNDKNRHDTLKIIQILFGISVITGFLLQILAKFIDFI